LGDHIRPDEAGHLDPPQAGACQSIDQIDLVRSGDGFRLILEAVARSYFSDLNVGG
jgi:hypothetical protein